MKKKKRKNKYPYYGSIFAPIFPVRQGTPMSTPPVSSSGSVAPVASGVSAGIGEFTLPPSRLRVIHEMRMVVSNITEYDNWGGTSAPSGMMADFTPGQPKISGPGFSPPAVPGESGVYDFNKSPGLGFRTEDGWKLWRAAMQLIPRTAKLTVADIIQAAMQRTGIRFGKMDPGELKLLEMGLQWYLSDTGRQKDGFAGVAGGLAVGQGNAGA